LSTTIDAVLPLIVEDFPRARILARSMLENFPLGACFVVVPEKDQKELVELFRPWSAKFVVVPEEDVVKELRIFRKLPAFVRDRRPGWYIQQIIKLAIASWIRSKFYLTLDADVIRVRPVEYGDLIHGERAVVRVSFEDAHPDWYQGSGRVLGLQRTPEHRTHGVTPALFSKVAVLFLQQYLEMKSPVSLRIASRLARAAKCDAVADALRSWRGLLLSRIPWTEYSLYHMFLEAKGMADLFHVYKEGNVICDGASSLWMPEQIAQWTAGSLEPEAPFIVAQSNTGIDVETVEQKVEPFLTRRPVAVT
jgi:hypothetical protein